MMRATVVLTAVLLLGCAPNALWSATTSDSNQAVPPASGHDPNVPPDYRIGADDVLKVAVWKEPEFTATLPVRTDGKISVPLLNDVQAAGLTPMELATTLTTKLQKYVENPKVTVVVLQMNHDRIFIIGEVLRHGPMSLLPDMTVMQALATAGLNQFANTKRIYVLRSVDGIEKKFPVNYKKLVKGQNASQNIVLKTGDTIVVP
jgi:polysaccharide biosynthesis/export protein